jgi:hypothetical protein
MLFASPAAITIGWSFFIDLVMVSETLLANIKKDDFLYSVFAIFDISDNNEMISSLKWIIAVTLDNVIFNNFTLCLLMVNQLIHQEARLFLLRIRY